MTERTRVGVIGCGFFAGNHLHAWTDLAGSGADLVAVCDTDGGKAEAVAKRHGVARWYTDAAAMFAAERLGLVDIVTQMDTHRSLAALAAEQGVAAVVQKPFGPTLDDCVAMAEAADAAGTFLAVHENFRFQLPFRKLIEVLRSGIIGEPTWARISFRTGYDIYAGQPYLRTVDRFVILDLGVHVLDVARALLGEAVHISAETQTRNRAVTGEDTATMLVRHSSGAVSVVECTYESRRLPDAFPETLVEIEGPKGAILLKQGLTLEITANGKTTTVDVDPPVLPWAERPWHFVQESVRATCAHMLDAVRGGREADTSARDNLKTYALCEAAYEAARSGRAVAPEFA